MSPASHVAVTVTGLMGQSSTDPRASFRLSDLRAFSLRPTRQSGGLTLENGLGAVATPGILCKRKERALGSKSVWRPSKQLIRLGGASSRRCFRRLSGPGHLPEITGPVPSRGRRSCLVCLRTPAAPCAGRPLRMEVEDAGAGNPASGEGPVHGIFRKLQKSTPGWFFHGIVE